ncbi:STAS/SEC14 domain-containing protein [Desulfovibrio sp. JC010]|uniref:STAS/SEC14 domain-containing protein n=1 Tax=Desulfovibrio sp. JC010 TaxID=2593641 RepID=UPI0013D0AB0F|nr:STAS/SEC14 domain-containing protein [Desulfovibrio sp. JC010]NDV26586.1 STAS/SEC14 domain-containing protein [Desulfovibrio sp. JC010]
MITIMKESSGPMLAVQATGKLSGDDYTEVWIPALREAIEKHNKCSCLLYMDENFEGWELKAMWEDASFGFAHRNDFDKLAVVGGPDWVEWGTKVAGKFMQGEVKTYPAEELVEALNWVTE